MIVDVITLGKMRILILLLFAVHVGCSSTQAPQNVQAELENVGDCFVASTFLLQREPDTLQELSQFLYSGKEASSNSEAKVKKGNFALLNFGNGGATIKTASGKQIVCRILKREHDNYGESSTAYITTYEFSVPDTNHSATRSVKLSMQLE